TISDLTLSGSTACITASEGARVRTGANVIFAGSSSTAHVWANGSGSVIKLGSAYSITSGGARHFYTTGGYIEAFSLAVTLSGTLNFSSSFAQAIRLGNIAANSTTFTGGTITGKRYDVSVNAIIFTSGGGASHFPGDSAGSTAT